MHASGQACGKVGNGSVYCGRLNARTFATFFLALPGVARIRRGDRLTEKIKLVVTTHALHCYGLADGGV